MDEIVKVLNMPAVQAGLKLLSPKIGIGVDLVVAILSGLEPEKKQRDVFKVIDRQIASLLLELSKPQTDAYRRELEIRIHTLLGVIFEWDKSY